MREVGSNNPDRPKNPPLDLGDFGSTLIDAAVDAIMVIDENGLIRHFSNSAQTLFGYTDDDCIGRNVSMLMPEPDRGHHDDHIQNYARTGQTKIIGTGRDVTGLKRNGETFPMHLSVGETRLAGERLFIGVCHDLTEYKSVLTKLARAEQRYKDIIQSQKQLICRLDSCLRITFANPSFSQLVGMQNRDLLGTPITAITTKGDVTLSTSLTPLFNNSAPVQEVNIKITMASTKGHIRVDWTFTRVDHGGEYGEELQGFGIDISEQEAALEQARYLRSHDALTGLYNRGGFIAAFEKWHRPDRRYALVHLDFFRFVLINQRYGHDTGDAIIINATRRMQETLDQPFLACRLGGDDLLVAIEVSDSRNALEQGRQIQSSLEEAYPMAEEYLLLNCSMGIALFPDDSDKLEHLIQLAEAALREAQSGPDAIVLFNLTHHRELRREIDIEQGLKRSLETGVGLTVFLQPKFSLATAQAHSFEALIRWQHPRLGNIPPAEFIPIAERTQLGQHLDQYVLSQVVDLLADSLAAGTEPLPVAVNITTKHFANPDLPEFIGGLLQQRQVPGHFLSLEITEGVIMDMSRHVSDNLRQLRELGIRISIDDFGTGYSSLSYLWHLDVDELKIDKSFIDRIDDRPGAILVDSVIRIAKAFNLEIVAEGIETEAQARQLLSMGCGLGQGFVFARPMPSEVAFQQFPGASTPGQA